MSDLSTAGRAVAVGAVAVALGATTLAGTAGAASGPARTAGSTPAVPAAGTAREAGLVAAEDTRLIDVRVALSRQPTDSSGVQQPFRMSDGGSYTLVLTARKTAYTLADLVRLEPQTLVRLPDGSFLLEENIAVAPGATLTLGGGRALTLRLESDAKTFVSLVSLGGTLQLRGAATTPLVVTSWDAGAGAPDRDLTDGRAYIRADGGAAAIDHVQASDLGFWSGRTGGVALTGGDRPQTGTVGSTANTARASSRAARAARKAATAADKAAAKAAADRALHAATTRTTTAPAAPAPVTKATTTPATTPSPQTVQPVAPVTDSAVTGEVSASTFTRDTFGLFVSDATGIRISSSTVSGSLADGVVLHHFVTGAVVTGTTSSGNAGSGFVLSRGVQGNVLSGDTASHNGVDGFHVSGAPLSLGPSPAGQSPTVYGSNEIVAATADGNAAAGVQLLSGHAETVQGGRFTGNAEGIVVRDGSTAALVSGSSVTGSRSNAITVRGGSDATLTGNTVDGGRNGIVVQAARAQLTNNVVASVSLHALSFQGDASGSRATGNILGGRGTSAVDLARATHRSAVTLTGNNAAGWVTVRGSRSWLDGLLQPINAVYAGILLVILLGSARTRRRRGSQTAPIRDPYASTQPLTAPTGAPRPGGAEPASAARQDELVGAGAPGGAGPTGGTRTTVVLP